MVYTKEQLTKNCTMELYDSGNWKKLIERKLRCKIYELFDANRNIYAHTLGVDKNRRKVIKQAPHSGQLFSGKTVITKSMIVSKGYL